MLKVYHSAGFIGFTGYFPCARMSNNQFTESSLLRKEFILKIDGFTHTFDDLYTFDDLLGKPGKWPYYHYHFEIRGLCELEFDGKLYCSILGSLDDLGAELEILTISYHDRVYDLLQNKDEGIAKTGFASFDGKSYIFTIHASSLETSWELYDENLRTYSLEFHSFSKQWPTAKGVEIVAAP